jgi:hypothetical protein
MNALTCTESIFQAPISRSSMAADFLQENIPAMPVNNSSNMEYHFIISRLHPLPLLRRAFNNIYGNNEGVGVLFYACAILY